MKITMISFFKNLFNIEKKLTINYPEEKYYYSDRFKGKPILTTKEDGTLRCTSCMLCVSYCPAECIHIMTDNDGDPQSEKTPVAFHIELLRCIFCGFCAEACPVDAIRMSGEYQMSGHAEQDWLLDHHDLAWRKNLNNGAGIVSIVDDKDRAKIRL